jgi:hypothetical protein
MFGMNLVNTNVLKLVNINVIELVNADALKNIEFFLFRLTSIFA